MRKTKCIIWFGICLLSNLAAHIAGADIPPPPEFSAAAQEGRNVKVTVRQQGGVGYFDITRDQYGIETPVVTDVNLSAEEPVSEVPVCGHRYYTTVQTSDFCNRYPDSCLSCDTDGNAVCIGTDCGDCLVVEGEFQPRSYWSGNEFCSLYPDYNVDCDADGTPECCLDCATDFYYDFWDLCVPAAWTTYYLDAEGGYDDEIFIQVIDSGEGCEEPSTDEPISSDEPVSTDEPVSSDEDIPIFKIELWLSGCSAVHEPGAQVFGPIRFIELLVLQNL